MNNFYPRHCLEEQVAINKKKIEALEGDVSSLEQQIDGIDVPNRQTTLSLVQNALTNINGWVLTRFSATLTSISGYDVYQIKLDGEDDILSEEDAIKYMEDMTGSKFLPRYDYFKPQNSFLVFADQTIWKPQYDDVNGLLLFKLPLNIEITSNKVTSLSGSSTDIQYPSAKAVWDLFTTLSGSMVFKGTLGTGGTIASLPSASSSNTGYTYKVIEDGTYASQSAKVGDLFVSNGTEWVLIPSGDDGSFVNPMTTQGDLIVGGASGTPSRVAIGTSGKVLKSTGTSVEWADESSGMANPMTTSQDIIVGGNSGEPTRLAKGSNGSLLGVNASGNLAYTNSLPIITTAPSQANTNGLIIVVLSSEPGTKYSGYLYLITE